MFGILCSSPCRLSLQLQHTLYVMSLSFPARFHHLPSQSSSSSCVRHFRLCPLPKYLERLSSGCTFHPLTTNHHLFGIHHSIYNTMSKQHTNKNKNGKQLKTNAKNLSHT